MPDRLRSAVLNLLTLLTLAATVCVIGVVAALFLAPGAVPGFLVAPTPPAQVSAITAAPTTAVPAAYPTLPPEWTATPSPLPSPSNTPNRFPSDTPTGVLGPAQTGLPNLNGTALSSNDARVSAQVATLRIRALAGSAGTIIATVPALTPLRVIGRIPDNTWLQVLTPDGTLGWAQANSLDVFVDLVGVPITAGAALQATATARGPTEPVDASIKPEGNHLRLRASPGTAGQVLSFLPEQMTLHLIGRTDDNVWLQVITSDKQQGWVLAQYINIYIGLDRIPVTGTAVNAPPPTQSNGTQPAGNTGPTNIAFVPTVAPTHTSPPTPTDTPLPTATPVPPSPTPLPTNTPTNPPPGGYNHPLPYLSGVSDHARQIYLAGLAAGNQPNVFSKIGDSITVAPPFLLPFGYGQFNLRDYGYLGEVVDHYATGWARNGNSFNNTSLAAKGGWSSFNVLSPSQADHALCRAGEPPLWCEYRLSRPSVALIMLGTNDVMDTSSDAYRANLQRIVGDSLDRGIVPVLSTIPAFHRAGYEARVAELNGIIADVAHQNDIPLWDYWSALEGLPNEGLGPDGIHPSTAPNSADFTADSLQFGYAVRNLTALQALDALWRLELY
jgi:GDSL-like Lipase/Acylhydrolase family/Bacterial SH3 domain